jgi:hypothetical protein
MEILPLTAKEEVWLQTLKQVIAFHSAQIPPAYRPSSVISFDLWEAEIAELERRRTHDVSHQIHSVAQQIPDTLRGTP